MSLKFEPAKRLPSIALCGLLFWPGFFAAPVHAQDHTTLGYRTCGTGQGTCHEFEGNWWKKDAHYETIQLLKEEDKNKALQIAQLYGMNPADYLKGDSKCAQCHGEVTDKRKTKRMKTGVSCENCHGPAGPEEGPNEGYFKIHQVESTGYRAALRVGLYELGNINRRAQECVRCHYINERRLLEAGHPTGKSFKYIRGIENNISRHWKRKPVAADSDNKPYEAARAKRGPIPEFTVKTLTVATTAEGTPAGPPRIIYRDRAQPPWLNPDNIISIEPFSPQVTDSSSVEEILLEVKKYIDYVHKRIRGK
ncbi:MAG: multiheme c-type cytochrome [bacterium]